MEGLPRQRSTKDNDSIGGGIHSPFLDLPDGFQRIRYYGFLSNRHREEKLALCRQLLGMPALDPENAPDDWPSDLLSECSNACTCRDHLGADDEDDSVRHNCRHVCQ